MSTVSGHPQKEGGREKGVGGRGKERGKGAKDDFYLD